MKKLMTLLVSAAMLFLISCPAFAQSLPTETGSDGWVKDSYYGKFKFRVYDFFYNENIVQESDGLVRITTAIKITDWGRRHYKKIKLPSDSVSWVVTLMEFKPETEQYRVRGQCCYNMSGEIISREAYRVTKWYFVRHNDEYKTTSARCLELIKELSNKNVTALK